MNEARRNPLAEAKRNGETIVQVADLGDGYCFHHFEIQAARGEDGTFAAMLVAVGGKASSIVGLQPVAVPLGPIGSIPLANLKKMFAEALGDKPPESPLVTAA